FLLFLLSLQPTPSLLFPYPTLFRSHASKPPTTRNRHRNSPSKRGVAVSAGSMTGPRATERGRFAGCAPPRGLAVSGHRGLAVSLDRKSTRLNSSHVKTTYAVFCLKK